MFWPHILIYPNDTAFGLWSHGYWFLWFLIFTLCPQWYFLLQCISWRFWLVGIEVIVIRSFKCCFWQWVSGLACHPHAFTVPATERRLFLPSFLILNLHSEGRAFQLLDLQMVEARLAFHKSKGQSANCGRQRPSKETANLKITLYISRAAFKVLSCTYSPLMFTVLSFLCANDSLRSPQSLWVKLKRPETQLLSNAVLFLPQAHETRAQLKNLHHFPQVALAQASHGGCFCGFHLIYLFIDNLNRAVTFGFLPQT